LEPVIITVYGKDFRKYGYNSKHSKLDASFCIETPEKHQLQQELNGNYSVGYNCAMLSGAFRLKLGLTPRPHSNYYLLTFYLFYFILFLRKIIENMTSQPRIFNSE